MLLATLEKLWDALYTLIPLSTPATDKKPDVAMVFSKDQPHIVIGVTSGLHIGSPAQQYLDNRPVLCASLYLRRDLKYWGAMVVDRAHTDLPRRFKDGTVYIGLLTDVVTNSLREAAESLAIESGFPVAISSTSFWKLDQSDASDSTSGSSSSISSSTNPSTQSTTPSSPGSNGTGPGTPAGSIAPPSTDEADSPAVATATYSTHTAPQTTWESKLTFSYSDIKRWIYLKIRLASDHDPNDRYFDSTFHFDGESQDSIRLLSATCAMRLPENSEHFGEYLQDNFAPIYTRTTRTGNEFGASGSITFGSSGVDGGFDAHASRNSHQQFSESSNTRFRVDTVGGDGRTNWYTCPSQPKGNWLGKQSYINYIAHCDDPGPAKLNFSLKVQYLQIHPSEGEGNCNSRITACLGFNNLEVPNLFDPTAQRNLIYRTYKSGPDTKYETPAQKGKMNSHLDSFALKQQKAKRHLISLASKGIVPRPQSMVLTSVSHSTIHPTSRSRLGHSPPTEVKSQHRQDLDYRELEMLP